MDPSSSVLAGDPASTPVHDTEPADLGALWRQARMMAAVRGAGDDADDVAQEVMLYLTSRGGEILLPSAWVRVVSSRMTSRVMRDRMMFEQRTVAWGREAEAEAPPPTTDSIAERDQILTWIRRLPRTLQEPVALYIDGWTPREIAELLGVSARVVRDRLARGREKLRQSFVAQMEQDRRDEKAVQTRRVRAAAPASRPPESRRPGPDEAAADLLPPRQREVLRLSYRGYKPRQIAKILGISPNTARVNLYHARKRVSGGEAGESRE